MIRLFLVIAAATSALMWLLPPQDPGTIPAVIRAKAVPLAPRDLAVNRVGALRYLGGWSLTSPDPRFGGLSSMAVVGDRVLALSDDGATFWFRWMPDGRIADAWIGRLPAGPGRGDRKRDRDSESMTLDPVTGRIWVGFEYSNAIWRYDPRRLRAEAHVAPKAMHDWPDNGGAEAMIRLPEGRFLVFSEEDKRRGNATTALSFPGDPTDPANLPFRFRYRAPAGYAVTDVALLPDGRLLLLHRRFTLLDGVSAVLSILDPNTIAAGRTVAGTEIARLAPPLTVDNMEALAVTQEAGRTIVWIASDDNFNMIQRTLLMRFALDQPGDAARRSAPR